MVSNDQKMYNSERYDKIISAADSGNDGSAAVSSEICVDKFNSENLKKKWSLSSKIAILLPPHSLFPSYLNYSFIVI